MMYFDNTTVESSTSIDHEGDQTLSRTNVGDVDGDGDIENWRQGVTSDDCGDRVPPGHRSLIHEMTQVSSFRA